MDHSPGRTIKNASRVLAETDINTIASQWLRTGNIDHLNKNTPIYGDFSSATDYMEALNAVRQAEDHFALLSAELRELCDNDPAKLLELAETEEGRAQIEALGGKFDAGDLPIPPKDSKPAESPPETPQEPAAPTKAASPVAGGE